MFAHLTVYVENYHTKIQMKMAKRFFLFLLGVLMMMPVDAQRLEYPVRMGVLLPLKEKSSRGAKMIEFYQGLLMAVDSVKHQGCTVEVTAVHSGTSPAAMDSLLAKNTFRDCDVIFGPLDVAQLPALADYCDLHEIRLVVPFSSLATQVPSHPLHYLVNAPRHMVQRQAVWFAQALFPDDNVIVVESGEKNEEGTALVERVRMAMDGRNVLVQQVSVNADDDAFCKVLEEERMNVLILDSSTLPAFTTMATKLRTLMESHKEYRISLFGYPVWQSYASQLQNDFYQFDTYIYTSFFRDPGDSRITNLEQQFKDNFGRPMSPTFPRYGLFGFDLGYYFLYGLGKYGNYFEANHAAITTEPFQNPLLFRQQSAADGYINDFVQIVHYASYHATEILYRNQE